MTLPVAHLEHAIPGRIRIRVPGRRGDTAYFGRVVEHLQRRIEGASLRASATTGSLLVLHQSEPAAIAALGREEGLFDLPVNPLRSQAAGPRSGRGNALPWLGGAAAAFGTLGLYQAARGRLGSSALETAWNAYNARSELKRPWLAALLAGMAAYNLAGRRVLPSAPSLLYFAATAWKFAQRRRNASVSDLARLKDGPVK
jgi:hypothetical protein